MAEGLIFHTRERNGFLNRCHAGVKLLMLLVVCITLSTASPLYTLTLCALILLSALLIRIPFKAYLSQGIFFIIIALFIYISEALNTKSQFQAIVATCRFLFTILSSLILIDTTGIDELAKAIAQIFYPIFRKYALLAASVIQLTFSMIPLVFDTAMTIREARIARGANFIQHPIKNTAELASAILSALLDNVSDKADSLSAREYDPYARLAYRGIGLCDVLLFAVTLLIAGGALWTRSR